MTDQPLLNTFRDATPQQGLKGRVVASLRQAGHLRAARQSSRDPRRVGRFALLAAAVVIAFLAGRSHRSGVVNAMSDSYLLLLYEDSSYRDDRPYAEIVSEYARWADSLASEGALLFAERLGEERQDVTARATTDSAVGEGPTGLFVVRAPDGRAAAALASSSPHVRQGGRIVVRRIARGS